MPPASSAPRAWRSSALAFAAVAAAALASAATSKPLDTKTVNGRLVTPAKGALAAYAPPQLAVTSVSHAGLCNRAPHLDADARLTLTNASDAPVVISAPDTAFAFNGDRTVPGARIYWEDPAHSDPAKANADRLTLPPGASQTLHIHADYRALKLDDLRNVVIDLGVTPKQRAQVVFEGFVTAPLMAYPDFQHPSSPPALDAGPDVEAAAPEAPATPQAQPPPAPDAGSPPAAPAPDAGEPAP